MDEPRVVRASDLSPQTGQMMGLTLYAGVAASTVGSKNIWTAYSTMAPGGRSSTHHHGDCETAIYVIRGHARFRFGERLERSIEAGPGDFVYLPPRTVHQEINASDSESIDLIVCRSCSENVVVNVDVPEAVVKEG